MFEYVVTISDNKDYTVPPKVYRYKSEVPLDYGLSDSRVLISVIGLLKMIANDAKEEEVIDEKTLIKRGFYREVANKIVNPTMPKDFDRFIMEELFRDLGLCRGNQGETAHLIKTFMGAYKIPSLNIFDESNECYFLLLIHDFQRWKDKYK